MAARRITTDQVEQLLMVFRPIADKTRWEGLVVCIWIALLDGLMLIWAIRRPVDWIKFGLVFTRRAQHSTLGLLGLPDMGGVHA